jgi:aldose 1-epimerase
MTGVEAAERRIELVAGASRLDLTPGIGGGIARLVLDGREVLRTAPGEARDPLELGEFPMAPWVNRIAGGRFSWRGRDICLGDSAGAASDALHGVVWRAPWDVRAMGEAEAVLELKWPDGPGWPFAFAITRRFVLSCHALEVEASLINTGDQAMPAALGFHPYFPSANARVKAEVTAGWTTANMLPRDLALEDAASQIRGGIAVRDIPLDNCLVGWNGEAVIVWPTHGVRLTTQPRLQHLQIFSPPGADFFCVEPQTAMPDALNRDQPESGLVTLAPGASLRVVLRFELCSSD